MILGAAMLFILSLITGDIIPVSEISLKGWLVILYLVVFGSIITFVALIYSMKKLPVAIASLYAYFNPLIAILTAGLILNEKFTMNILWGAIVTLGGVFLVNYSIPKNNEALQEPQE